MTIATSTATSLSDLKAVATSQVSMIYDRSVWTWKLGDFTGQADDVNVVKADSSALTVGAWVRQLSDQVYIRNFPGVDPTGETSSAGAFTAALARGKRVVGGPGDIYLLDASVAVPADREIIGNGASLKLAPGAIGLRLSQPRSKVSGWTIIGNKGLYAVLIETKFCEFTDNYCSGNIGHYCFCTSAENVTIAHNRVEGLTADAEITTAFVAENSRHVAVVDNQIFNMKQGWAIQMRGSQNFVISNNTIYQPQYSDIKTASAGQTSFTFNIGEVALIELSSGKPKVRVQVNGKPLSPTTPNRSNPDQPNIIYAISGVGPTYTINFTNGLNAGDVVKLIGYRGAENIQINYASRDGIIANNTMDGTADAGIIALGSHLSITGNKIRRAGYASIAIYGGQDNIAVTGNTIIDGAQMDDGRSSPDDYRLSSPFAGGLFIAGENIAVTGNVFINDSGTMNYGVMIQKTDMALRTDGSAAITVKANQYSGTYASGRVYIPNQTPGQRANSIDVDGADVRYPLQLDLEAAWVEQSAGSAAQGKVDPASNYAVTVSGPDAVRVVRNTSDTVDGGVAMQTVAGSYIDLTYNRMGLLKDGVVIIQFWAKNIGGNSYAHVATKLLGQETIYEVSITASTWTPYVVRIAFRDLDAALRLRFGANFGAANIQHVQVVGRKIG